MKKFTLLLAGLCFLMCQAPTVGADSRIIFPGSSTFKERILQVFVKEVMQGKKISENAKVVDISSYMPFVVGKAPGNIGILSENMAKAHLSRLHIVETRPLSRPLVIITKGAPTPEVQKVVDFLKTEEAQKNFK